MLIFALSTVVIVVLFITFDIRITILVVLMVLLVIMNMTGICYYWGLTLNNIFALNLTFALGIAVDFAVHIAHKYLLVVPPSTLKTNKEKRDYKVAKAISMMGPSVLYGGLSTLLAVMVICNSRMYYFIVFFKTWFCMMIFGMLNGIILQPIILSFLGPVDSEETPAAANAISNNDDEDKEH